MQQIHLEKEPNPRLLNELEIFQFLHIIPNFLETQQILGC